MRGSPMRGSPMQAGMAELGPMPLVQHAPPPWTLISRRRANGLAWVIWVRGPAGKRSGCIRPQCSAPGLRSYLAPCGLLEREC